MTLGLEWNENVPYTSTANSEIAMESAPDRFHYILRQPIVEEPGVRWSYCGGASALLARLIGQRIYVAPALDLVVAVTAGQYDRPDQPTASVVLDEVILPGIVS
ncbi:hypothetical protein ABZ260_02710 [Streptosporangium sp. NPDC006013]|uniref:hypothetical protein n=1 Tax=Streptosporangium sp. NPDC006013 TaxID=3155596 RepID=UPI0033BF5D49